MGPTHSSQTRRGELYFEIERSDPIQCPQDWCGFSCGNGWRLGIMACVKLALIERVSPSGKALASQASIRGFESLHPLLERIQAIRERGMLSLAPDPRCRSGAQRHAHLLLELRPQQLDHLVNRIQPLQPTGLGWAAPYPMAAGDGPTAAPRRPQPVITPSPYPASFE